ncbi:hypothetical protein [Methylobacillus sp.]|uniref:hypothetical protein n=1 Tax=Methylobacillus sp. TaxID=56818 RepID=UPI0012BE2AFD|nr:hypothetical protein [Methylobacillus sp.]MPS48602.1 hypothetical protein [Methylobacillus sp.]
MKNDAISIHLVNPLQSKVWGFNEKWYEVIFNPPLCLDIGISLPSLRNHPLSRQKTFEESANQEMLERKSSRESMQFRGLNVTEFDDS